MRKFHWLHVLLAFTNLFYIQNLSFYNYPTYLVSKEGVTINKNGKLIYLEVSIFAVIGHIRNSTVLILRYDRPNDVFVLKKNMTEI